MEDALPLAAVCLLGLLFFRGLVLFPLMSVYIIWSIIKWTLDKDRLSLDLNSESNLEKNDVE